MAPLQRILAEAGVINKFSTLDKERCGLIQEAPTLRPLDMSFSPDPSLNFPETPQYSFAYGGYDVTITSPQLIPTFFRNEPIDYTAKAEAHIQKAERGKSLRAGIEADDVNKHNMLGEQIIQHMLDSNLFLIPIAIDPHSSWGPMFQNYMCGHTPTKQMTFPKVNMAITMHDDDDVHNVLN